MTITVSANNKSHSVTHVGNGPSGAGFYSLLVSSSLWYLGSGGTHVFSEGLHDLDGL